MADAPVRLPEDRPRGRRAVEKGCQLGNLDACRELFDYQTDRTRAGHGLRQDLFMQARGRFMYSIIVTAPAHDPDLLARVRAGMRFAAAPVP